MTALLHRLCSTWQHSHAFAIAITRIVGNAYIYIYIYVRLRRVFLTLDTIEVLFLVYLNYCAKLNDSLSLPTLAY